ncbi:LysR family transcriptional regulator [Nocardia terpenica]|nr:LysR family transcriptional regulator [Nocardia terpenica]MBF6063061.1 LysR family transcriptional regulator [Nocardia terpenica]MBF6104804.1 LysR family transcriptional regulator [Nocardia terpenica]MBF6112760.1 LysR family transcriptional regulator [Nocardia terpenica]MBF6118532.1 LysR family transcriptional regulator [Nocardia terpenica]MBF6155011.1 LysR family transcriptional regulator [Nocardia terpenica]
MKSDGSPRAANLDLNLLVALDALLDTSSVTLAAERLRTSPPAVSRALARLRRALGDPLLVRAGRDLVPTPRALQLRGEVAALLEQARTLLTPHAAPEIATLERVFTIQASDAGLIDIVAPLTAAVRAAAPGVVLRFLPDSLEGSSALRDGRIDLEVGAVDQADPETVVEPVARVGLFGIAAAGHPLTTGPVTPESFAAAAHLGVSRRGRIRGPIDDRLAELGLSRRVVATVPGYAAALLAVRLTGLVTLAHGRPDAPALTALDLRPFEIPLDLPPVQLSLAWHPRHTADDAHRWLRARVHEALSTAVALPVDE